MSDERLDMRPFLRRVVVGAGDQHLVAGTNEITLRAFGRDCKIGVLERRDDYADGPCAVRSQCSGSSIRDIAELGDCSFDALAQYGADRSRPVDQSRDRRSSYTPAIAATSSTRTRFDCRRG